MTHQSDWRGRGRSCRLTSGRGDCSGLLHRVSDVLLIGHHQSAKREFHNPAVGEGGLCRRWKLKKKGNIREEKFIRQEPCRSWGNDQL